MSIRLNQENLKAIKPPALVPAYSRDTLDAAVVHIGLGHFHRAHQALFLDRLLAAGHAKSGIFEINLVKDTLPVASILNDQDYLYTLITKNKKGEADVRVIGAITGYLNATSDKAGVIKRLAAPETALISLTITEKGYCFDVSTGELAWDHPAIAHDVEHPDDPQSALGFLALALEQRSKAGALPLTIMSCDNFPSNGRALKKLLLSFCRRVKPGLIPWIEENAAFPCSMVDRITPNTSEANIRETEEKYGISDGWPVCAEDFIQWVLEDNFKLPPNAGFDPRLYAKAGVQLVKDVEPYELMKMRLLNGSHSALAYISYLMGYRGVAEAAEDALLGPFIRKRYMEEASATLGPVEGIDLTQYKDTLIDRFSNRNIADTILRLCEDGSTKIPNFIIKPLKETIRDGKEHSALVFALAGWARFLTGADEAGEAIPLKDPNAAELSAAAQKARTDPEIFLRAIGVQDLAEGDMTKLTDIFKAYLEQFYRLGARKTLEQFLQH